MGEAFYSLNHEQKKLVLRQLKSKYGRKIDHVNIGYLAISGQRLGFVPCQGDKKYIEGGACLWLTDEYLLLLELRKSLTKPFEILAEIPLELSPSIDWECTYIDKRHMEWFRRHGYKEPWEVDEEEEEIEEETQPKKYVQFPSIFGGSVILEVPKAKKVRPYGTTRFDPGRVNESKYSIFVDCEKDEQKSFKIENAPRPFLNEFREKLENVIEKKPERQRHDPLTILKIRFAKGEISKQEYEEMKKTLEE